MRLSVCQGHVAFLERVGLRPTESSNKDGSLGTDSYSQMYAVNKLQAVWRGKQGRRRAEERAANLRAEYAEMMLTITGASAIRLVSAYVPRIQPNLTKPPSDAH